MGEAMVQRYFDAWDAHDPEAVAACFADGGTFHDAVTGGPVGKAEVGGFVTGFAEAFPDYQLPIERLDVIDEHRAIAEFRIVGTHTGDSAMGPATDATVDLPGVDIITFDDDGLITSVRGHWDMAAFLGQLGLQLNPSPVSIPGLVEFGMSVRVHSGRATQPGAFTVTSTDATGDDANWVRQTTEATINELVGQPGYLGGVMGDAGGRFYTFTAWESPEAVKALHQTEGHRTAMREMLNGNRCTRIMTSIWTPHRFNVTKAAPEGEKPVPVTTEEQWL